MIGVDDLDVVIDGDIAGCDRARTLLAERQGRLVAIVHAQRNLLQVEQNVDDILLHALDGGVLMQHAIDLCVDDGRTRHRRQQNTTQGIAQRMTETALERLQGYLGMPVVDGLHIDDARLQEFVDVSEHEAVPQ